MSKIRESAIKSKILRLDKYEFHFGKDIENEEEYQTHIDWITSEVSNNSYINNNILLEEDLVELSQYKDLYKESIEDRLANQADESIYFEGYNNDEEYPDYDESKHSCSEDDYYKKLDKKYIKEYVESMSIEIFIDIEDNHNKFEKLISEILNDTYLPLNEKKYPEILI